MMKLGDRIEQRAAFAEALLELGAENQAVMVFDADVGTSTYTARFRDAYPDRFVQTGIAEQNMVGMAAGMSTLGLIPWVSTFAVFLAKRALDQIRVSIAYAQLNVKLIATDMMTPKALHATLELEKENIHVRLIHMPTIKPLDVEAVVKASRETGQIITVENHSRLGGLGSAVAETLTEHAPCRLCRLGFPDVFGESGNDEAVFSKLGVNTESIVAAARQMIREK